MKKIVSLLLGATMFVSLTAPTFAATATVSKGVNFRAQPSTSSKVYSLLPTGTKLNVLSEVNNYWLKVSANGKVGYVSTNYVKMTSSQPSNPAPSQTSPAPSTGVGTKIVNTAKSFEGKVKYAFSVRDAAHLTFDCSSFTQYVFGLNGITIPWGSKAQAAQGTYVSKSNLKPGDLVFFSVSTPGQINHVGIYIGNGQFINNLPNQGVVISNINSSYWTSHYITARRVTT